LRTRGLELPDAKLFGFSLHPVNQFVAIGSLPLPCRGFVCEQMTGGTLAAKQGELLKESFPDLPRLTVLGDSLSTAQLVGAEHATGWLGRQDSNLGMAESKSAGPH
jgi:hypothetical protein